MPPKKKGDVPDVPQPPESDADEEDPFPEEPEGKIVKFTVSVDDIRDLCSVKSHDAPGKVCVEWKFFNHQKRHRSPMVPANKFTSVNFTQKYDKDINTAFMNQIYNDPLEMVVYDCPADCTVFNRTDCKVLGRCKVDVSPLLQGECEVDARFPIELNEENEYKNEEGEDIDRPPNPQMDVVIYLSEPLLTKEEMELANLLTFRIAGVQALPWSLYLQNADDPDSQIFKYHVDFEIPVSATATKKISMATGATAIPENYEPEEPPPEESKPKTPADKKKKGEAEPEPEPEEPPPPFDPEAHFELAEGKQFIQFNEEVRLFMFPDGAKRFRETIEAGELWDLEFTRNLKDHLANDPKNPLTDPNFERYRGVARCDLKDLVEVGKNEHLGRYFFSEPAKPEGEEEEGKAPPAKGKGGKNAYPQLEPEDDPKHPLEKAHTFVKIDWHFEKALNPAPTGPPPAFAKPSDLIRRRAPMPLYEEPADASVDYRENIESTVEELVQEFIRVTPKIKSDSSEETKAKFVFLLNNSGKYYILKEKLKKSVVRIVRERFHKKGGESKDEIEVFTNDLYVYLVDEMHARINKVFTPDVEAKGPLDDISIDELKALSEEAETNLNFVLADRYLQERIVKKKGDPVLWCDYAYLNMRMHDISKADECFREVIALHPEYRQALFAYGFLLCEQENFSKGEVFLRGALELEGESQEIAEPWAFMALFYKVTDNMDKAEYAEKKARRYLRESEDNRHIYLIAAEFLLELQTSVMAERALMEEQLKNGTTEELAIKFARLYMQREDFMRAEQNLEEALAINQESRDAWRYLGHVQYLQKRAEAMDSYNSCLNLYSDAEPCPDIAVYLRLGSCYLNTGDYASSRDLFLRACKLKPSATSWLGAGISYFKREEYAYAEDCLSEANILDNFNSEVWGYLSLLCMVMDRDKEGELSLKEGLKHNLSNPDILREIAEHQFRFGKFKIAEGLLMRSLQSVESAHTRRILADVYQEQNLLEEAIEQYQLVVDNFETEADRAHAQRELEKLCGMLDRMRDQTSFWEQAQTGEFAEVN